MPTTLPVRIAIPANAAKVTAKDAEASDGSIVVVFLVTAIGMLLSVIAALISPTIDIGM